MDSLVFDTDKGEADKSDQFKLVYDDHDRLTLLDNLSGLSIQVDFIQGKTAYRAAHSGKHQTIAKAVGVCAVKEPLNVLDATAGLGRDAFILASLGCQVTLIERSPMIHALLQDGLKRAAAYPKTCQIAARLHLIHTDAVSYMQSLSEKEKPDVIYLDPMFPDRKKSAKVKKEMQVLQALLGHETPLETEKLFEAALNCAQQSVVVKRPKLAPCISQKLKPHHILQGKTCRFEVFSRLPENFSLPEKGSY